MPWLAVHRKARRLVTLVICATLYAGCASAPAKSNAQQTLKPQPLLLTDFKPKSMLQATVTETVRARYPVIDVHQHVNDAHTKHPLPVADLLTAMDRHNVRTLVILTGSTGQALQAVVDRTSKLHPDRFIVFAQMSWDGIDEPGFGERMAARLAGDVKRGARGLKITPDLGLDARDSRGHLIAIDDPRIDPIWAACATLNIPVAMHIGNPEAFFEPVDGTNERYDELSKHPDWAVFGTDRPAKRALLDARDRVIARHPKTQFIGLHVANWPENLDYVSALLDRFPNLVVEFGARQAELGRQPRRARRFFIEYQDRIMFGTDVSPSVRNGMGAAPFSNYFRWLETADEYFDYYGAPSQGRWKIYGLELPDAVLKKVYHTNAERILRLKPSLMDASAAP